MYNFEERTAYVDSLAKNLQIPYLFSTLWLKSVHYGTRHISYASNVTFFLEKMNLVRLLRSGFITLASSATFNI